jgi:5'-3' exonuclease
MPDIAQQAEPRERQASLLIIDSFALLFRGFYSLAASGNYMRTSSGLCTNGLYQFTRYMMDAITRFRPTHVVCAFDMGKETFRSQMYPPYKANRQEPPAELIPQFDKLWELVSAFDIPCVGRQGFEADDIIGSLAKKFAADGVRVHILTGDGDTLQLVDESTQVIFLQKGFGNYEAIHLQNFREKKQLDYPWQVVELKALMGDTADNIPGCPHVGPKTGLKLLGEYGSVDGIYEHIDQIKGKLRERLEEHRDLVYLSRDLAAIRTDLELACSLEECLFGFDREKVRNMLQELEFPKMGRMIAG